MPKKKNGRYRYTDDYRTVSEVDERGRKRNRFIYTGKWFCVMNEPDEYRRIVLTVRALSAVSLIMAIAALMIQPAPVNGRWYLVGIAVSLFPISYLLMGAVMLPREPKPMESARHHRSVLRTLQSSVFGFVVLSASAAGWIAYWILTAAGRIRNAAPYTVRDTLVALSLAIAAGSCFLIRNRMKRIRIEERENPEVSSRQGNEGGKD